MLERKSVLTRILEWFLGLFPRPVELIKRLFAAPMDRR